MVERRHRVGEAPRLVVLRQRVEVALVGRCRRRTAPRPRSSRGCRRRGPRRRPRSRAGRCGRGTGGAAHRRPRRTGAGRACRARRSRPMVPSSPTNGFDARDAVLRRWARPCPAGRSAGSCRTACASSCGTLVPTPIDHRHRPRRRAGRSRRHACLAVGLKSICWIAVDLAGEAEPQDLAAGARERVRRSGWSAVHSVTTPAGTVRLRWVRRRLGAEVGELLGVDGVEPPVLLELGVERDEPEPAAHATPGEEVRELGLDVEVDVPLRLGRAGRAAR